MAESPPVTAQSPEAVISFEQYLKQYDGTRAEWVAGKVVVYIANNEFHQRLLIFLTTLFSAYFDLRPVGRLLIASFSMFLGNDKAAREPDLLIVLNKHLSRIKATYLDGVADIVVEIVSPESVERDYGTKFKEYEEAGVPEYWVIDPERHVSDVYALDDSGRYHRLPPDSAGRLVSSLLPDFALDPAVLWQEAPPQGMALLRLVLAMTGTDLNTLLDIKE